MSGGGKQEVVQNSEPFRQQLPYVQDVFRQAQANYRQGPDQFYPGQTVADQSQDTINAQVMARAGAGNQNFNAAYGNAAFRRLLQNPDPANDPTVNRFAEAATRPLYGDLANQLNADDGRAMSQGAFGGNRLALARGSTLNDGLRTIGDVRAGIYNNAFNTQSQQRLQALGMLPQINAANTTGAETLSRVGAQNENYSQSLIDAERERFDFEQRADDLSLNQYANLVNQFSGPTSSTTNQSGGSSVIGNVAGGIMAGVGARSLFS